jgi:hypothetical protein
MPRGFRQIKLAFESAAEEFPRLTAMLDLMIRKSNVIPCTKHARAEVKVDEVNEQR